MCEAVLRKIKLKVPEEDIINMANKIVLISLKCERYLEVNIEEPRKPKKQFQVDFIIPETIKPLLETIKSRKGFYELLNWFEKQYQVISKQP